MGRCLRWRGLSRDDVAAGLGRRRALVGMVLLSSLNLPWNADSEPFKPERQRVVAHFTDLDKMIVVLLSGSHVQVVMEARRLSITAKLSC